MKRHSSRDLSDPQNLIHAVKKALGLEVIEYHFEVRVLPGDRRRTELVPGKGTGGERTYYESQRKYPADLEREGRLPDGRRVRLLPSFYGRGGVKTGQHRIQVECPECGQWIPVGRYLQHMNTRACRIYHVCQRHEDCRALPALGRACFFAELERSVQRPRRQRTQ